MMPGDGDPKVVIRVNPGEPVFVRAFIANDDRPVPGVRWQVKARTPAGAIILIPVMDDGLHADGAAADGIFVGAIIAEDGPDGFYALSAEGQPPQGARYLQRVEVEAKGDLQHYRKRRRNSLVGWDYCRYIMLCRCGYQVGFLSEDEAWGRIMPMARAIQAAFPSWSVGRGLPGRPGVLVDRRDQEVRPVLPRA